MKKTNIRLIYFLMLGLGLVTFSCKKTFLNQFPNGVLGDEQVATAKGIKELLIGAYADLDGQFDPNNLYWQASPDNWVYGSICGGDAHKGSDPSDQADALPVARFEALPTNSYLVVKWRAVYDGIARANNVLRTLKRVTDMTDDQKTQAEAEARFLRGHYAFEAKKMWNMVPWVSDSVTYVDNNYKIPNDKDIWPEIEADFQFAYQNLPPTQDEVGRVNKWAAGCYLAKAYLFEKKYPEALTLLNAIMPEAGGAGETANGLKYQLQDRYSWNFDLAHNNSSESVFAVQATTNDNTAGYNGNIGDMLNYPYGNGAVTGCCGFFQPSIELANSFRTDASGLPLLDGSYDDPGKAVKNDQGLASSDSFTPDAGNLDPRLDHTVGRRGIPYLDWGVHPGASWIRNQASAGPYSPIKNVFHKSQVGSGGDNASATWAPTNAINYTLIRYADVLLWAAECEVQAGSLEKARSYVNEVRQRAANTADFVKNGNQNAANYKIGLYNTPWVDKATALKAVQMERKLELGMEGHRFFDLVRWGIADEVLNAYFKYEGQFTGDIKGATFKANTNDYFPIPQRQIDLSSGTLKQNPGYN